MTRPSNGSMTSMTASLSHSLSTGNVDVDSLHAATTALPPTTPSSQQAPSSSSTSPATPSINGLAIPPRRTGTAAIRRTGRHSSKFGTVNYSVDEMRRLNEKVRAVMPIVGEDWLHVAYQFNYMRPESIPYREVESLKRKFKKMYCARASSNGKLPDYVEEAKELRRMINQRSEKAHLDQSDSHSEMDGQEPVFDATMQSSSKLPNEPFGSLPPDASHHVTSSRAAMAPLHAATMADMQMASEAMTKRTLGTTTVPTPSGSDRSELLGETMSPTSEADDQHDIAARLRQIEEEYKRQQTGADAAMMAGPASSGSASSFTAALHASSDLSSISQLPASTSGIISMLKQSVERKKRTVEEQMLSESERVRKERKKRKMEQVLYSIHQEQQEKQQQSVQVPGASAAGPSSTPSSTLAAGTSPSTVAQGSNATASAQPNVNGPYTSVDSASVSLMEVLLQFMTAQQYELQQRQEQEDERRRKEEAERKRRRAEKEAQRAKEKQEMMLLMSALLGDRFPSSLQHYLQPSNAGSASSPKNHSDSKAEIVGNVSDVQQEKNASSSSQSI